MLESLTIKNTAIIDFLTVNFGEGMNCLTGETGAGKSIIIDSICCLLGERVSRESVRRGAQEGQVTGVFSTDEDRADKINDLLLELGIEPEPDGTIILYRSFSVSGKNVCRINDRMVTLTGLKRLGELLVDVHGQHDNHSLLSPSTHISLLDSFAGPEFLRELTGYRRLYERSREIERELEEISGDPYKRAQMIDLLSFQVNEIDDAGLRIGEDEELEAKQKKIDNAEKISSALASALSSVAGGDSDYDEGGKGARDLVEKAADSLRSIAKYSEKYEETISKLKEASYLLEDVQDGLRDSLEEDSFDPEEASEVEARLDVLYSLKRKYGATIGDVLAFGEEAQKKLDALTGSEERANALLKEKKKVLGEMAKLAANLHSMREDCARVLEQGVTAALADMEMNRVKFRVDIAFDEEETPRFLVNGLDTVEFLISTNPGEPLKPLSRIASGGELSRIMLAIKSCLADVDDIPVLIFDEIDTGISGAAATSVARKFLGVSKSHQVICVSHLAQIAAISDCNIYISKTFGESDVRTEAVILDPEGKVCEVARLMDGAGERTEITMAHSRDLIARMRAYAEE